ncbi:MAG TPA: hypothetical protein DIC34_10190 [Treponema sp.]|nr:MAG: hypothetical protein A2413_06960 [Treponema sp. RIFOXYC1_FULL_61_9]HCM26896.1 hypothetical protein [Treponema sp.]
MVHSSFILILLLKKSPSFLLRTGGRKLLTSTLEDLERKPRAGARRIIPGMVMGSTKTYAITRGYL